jgi:hypothetical protein
MFTRGAETTTSFLLNATTACARKTGAATTVERRRRREPARVISLELLVRGSASPFRAYTRSALENLGESAPLVFTRLRPVPTIKADEILVT